MRSVGSEFLSAMAVLSVPIWILAVFPFEAVWFRAADAARHPVWTAFVTLTPSAEQRALRAVRASWKEKVGGVGRLQADLFSAELPQDERMSVLTLRDRSRSPALPAVRCERTPFLPSQKAPPPTPIAAGTETDPLEFPREDLLKMN